MKMNLLMTGGAVFACAALQAAPAFSNPSFEQGTSGYWINNASAARVEPGEASDGKQSLGIRVVPGKTVSVVQGLNYEANQYYKISFDAKGSDAQLRLQIMLQGNKPLQFFSDPDLKKPFPLTDEFKRFSIELGPFPESIGSNPVKKLMIYFNVTGKEGGKVNLDNLSVELKEAAKTSEKSILKNGSFEQGMAQYWVNRRKCAEVVSGDASHGRKSLKVTPEDKTVDLVQGVPMKPGEVYTVRFDAKSSAPENGPQLKLGILMRGKTPLAYFAPKGEQKRFAEPVPVEKEYKTFEYEVGPLPEDWRGTKVENLMFYWHIKPGANPGSISLDNLQIETAPAVQKKNNGISFQFPGDIRIFEKGFPLRVSHEAGTGILKVRGSDALGRELFSAESQPGRPELSIEIAEPGYYAVSAEVIEEGKCVKQATTTFAVTTPLPEDYYSTPQPAFGVWGGLNPELRRLGGAKWDRQLFFTIFQKKDFQAVEPTPEKIAAREPINIIRCMNILNPFKKMVPVKEEEWPELEKKLEKEILSRKGLVQVWETQNEPMVGENFHGTMDDVMDIIRFESRIVRKINPEAAIAGICINPMNANQYNQYLGYYRNHGIDRLIDGVMLHPYIPGAQNPDLAGYVETLNRLNRELSAIAGHPVPMYISEIGYSAKPGGEVTEYQQAAYLARVMILNFTITNLKACVWHIGLWNEATSQRELDFALIRKQTPGSKVYQPKPSFAAWATASRMLYNAKLLRELNVGKAVRVWLFEKEGRPMLVAYSLVPEPVRMQLALQAPEAEIVDVCGRRSRVECRDGILRLELGEGPSYIFGGTLEQFAAGKFDAVFTPEKLAVVPGGTLSVKIRLPEHLAAGAKLQLQPFRAGSAQLSGSGRDWTMRLSVSPEAAPGECDLFLMLKQKGSTRYIWQKTLEVLPKLTMTEVNPTEKNGAPALSFVLQANDPKERQANVEIVAEDGKVIGSGSARVGERTELALPQAAVVARPTRYEARLTPAAGKPFRVALPGNPLPVRIPYCRDAVSLPVEEWSAAGAYVLETGTFSRHTLKGEVDRPAGKLHLACDEKYLYLDCEVKDREFLPAGDDASLWNGDSLQIGISVPQADMFRANNDGIQETAYAEFGVSADNRSWVWASMNLNRMGLAAPVPGMISHSKITDGVLLYRVAIPWETLNIRYRPGLGLRLSILVNDRDRAGRHWLEWFGGIADGKDPGAYGEARIMEVTK